MKVNNQHIAIVAIVLGKNEGKTTQVWVTPAKVAEIMNDSTNVTRYTAAMMELGLDCGLLEIRRKKEEISASVRDVGTGAVFAKTVGLSENDPAKVLAKGGKNKKKYLREMKKILNPLLSIKITDEERQELADTLRQE